MSEETWDEMRESLMGLTVRQLRQIARDEGICLGHAASRAGGGCWTMTSVEARQGAGRAREGRVMRREPESVRDMAWAAQQQAGNAIAVEYRNADNEPSEGALSHTEVNVTAWEYRDEIEVSRSTYRYKEPLKTGGWSLEGEHETLARLSFEEFMASEWCEPYLAKTRRLNFDSSWMDSFRVDADEDFAAVTFYAPEYQSAWWCSSDVPTGETVRCEVDVSSDGTVRMQLDGESEESTVSELIEAVRRLRTLEEAGVSVDDEGNVIVRKTAERGEE